MPANVRFSIDGCELWIEHPVPGVLVTRATGSLTLPAARPLMEAFDDAARSGWTVEAFHDWSGVVGYTPEAREAYVRWSIAGKAKRRFIAVLVRSKLLAMGISVANLKLGYLSSFTDASAFDLARERSIARRRAQLVKGEEPHLPRGSPHQELSINRHLFPLSPSGPGRPMPLGDTSSMRARVSPGEHADLACRDASQRAHGLFGDAARELFGARRQHPLHARQRDGERPG